jgi:outer membrane receptor protein involved in Fe transport
MITNRSGLKAALLTSAMMVMSSALSAQEVEEIVVQGVYIPDEKRATSEISSLIDEVDFAQSGDSEVAGILQRVTGLSLVSGKFIYVRGLGGRYSYATLDGSTIPSPEPLRRVVPLDIFPTSLLGEVLVQKTYSPQFQGEFGGGLIELRTKAVPDERFFEFGVSGGYNSEATFKDGLSYDGPNTEIFGFPGKSRSIPDIIDNNALLEGMSAAELEAAGESLPNIWSVDREPNAPDFGLNAVYGDRFDFADSSLGILAALDYSSEMRNEFGEFRTFEISDGELTPSTDLAPEICDRFVGGGDDCGLRRTEWDVGLNGIFTLGLELDQSTLKATSMVLRKSTKRVQIEKGEFGADPGTLRTSVRNEYIENYLWTNQLSGEHFFDALSDNSTFEQTQFNWRASYSKASREAPFRRQYRYIYDDFDSVFRLPLRTDSALTSWSDLKDVTYDGGVDILQPMLFGDMAVDLKLGAAYLDKSRDSGFVQYGFNPPSGANLELRELIPEIIFGPVNIGPGGFELREFFDASDTFTASLENKQVYGGLDIQLNDFVRLAGGLRYEDSKQITATVDRVSLDPITVTQRGEYVLPAATLTWEFYDNMQMRFAFSQTLSRPDLRETSSAIFLDDRGQQTRGNPELQIAQIDNYDARWEWYFGPGEFATVGVFYKEFSNPIEQTYQFIGNTPLRSWANALSAEVKGIEAELEKTIPLSDWMDNGWTSRREFYVKVNGSYIDSNVSLDPTEAGQQTDSQRSLEGQSDWLGNLQFGWDEVEDRERFSILLNYTGERIIGVGRLGAPNEVEKPPISLDLNYARTLTTWGRDYEVSLKAANLLNDDFVIEQGNQIAERYDLGVTVSVGIKTRF